MAQLINTAQIDGLFDTFDTTASTQAVVELDAVSIAKTADKAIWVDGDGNLTYTVTVKNLDKGETPLDVTEATLTDTITPTIATLVAGSVEVNGVAVPADPGPGVVGYTFNATTGLLTVYLDTIPPSALPVEDDPGVVVTFQVTRV